MRSSAPSMRSLNVANLSLCASCASLISLECLYCRTWRSASAFSVFQSPCRTSSSDQNLGAARAFCRFSMHVVRSTPSRSAHAASSSCCTPASISSCERSSTPFEPAEEPRAPVPCQREAAAAQATAPSSSSMPPKTARRRHRWVSRGWAWTQTYPPAIHPLGERPSERAPGITAASTAVLPSSGARVAADPASRPHPRAITAPTHPLQPS
mmetsp:Transcript_66387/g.157321  ORF Transcript_66387/g.157321 Transcript_66387/m.157321 type:complete len:211 (-) Transcript_66387:22-654(-)